MNKLLKTMSLILVIIFTSCNSNDAEETIGTLTLNLSGLEDLGSNFNYEGWIIVNGNPVSTGVFSSTNFPQTFAVNQNDLNAATTFVLTIEPANDLDASPSKTKLLSGEFSNNTATVSSKSLVADFSNATGKYILATPTDNIATNEDSGVWFLDNSSGSPMVGLNLPTLQEGWKYEGWVVFNGTPISTGTFVSATAADDNAANSIYKGLTGNGPSFPGEDYLRNAPAGLTFPTSLIGKTIVISVEPYPDNSASPFTLKPLAHVVPQNAAVHSVLTMNVGPVKVLTGSVTR